MNNFILVFFIFFVSIANAKPEIVNNELMLNKKEIFLAQSKSLNELEAEETLDKLKQHLSEMGKLWDIKYTECYRAVGNDKFCKCIEENLPLALSFVGYTKAVQIRESTDKEYMSLPDTTKELIRMAREVRNKCVQVF